MLRRTRIDGVADSLREGADHFPLKKKSIIGGAVEGDRPKLVAVNARPAPRQPSPQAYDAYLEGRAFFGRAGVASVTKAAERFAEATRVDSDFALAWAWQSIANEYPVDDGLRRSNEAMPAAAGAPGNH